MATTFPASYRTESSSNMCTRNSNRTLFCARLNTVRILTLYLQTSLILSSYLCLDNPNNIFPSDISTINLGFVSPCIIIYSNKSTNQMHQSLSFIAWRLTLRRLMSYIYIYGAPILDVSRSHTTTHHSR